MSNIIAKQSANVLIAVDIYTNAEDFTKRVGVAPPPYDPHKDTKLWSLPPIVDESPFFVYKTLQGIGKNARLVQWAIPTDQKNFINLPSINTVGGTGKSVPPPYNDLEDPVNQYFDDGDTPFEGTVIRDRRALPKPGTTSMEEIGRLLRLVLDRFGIPY